MRTVQEVAELNALSSVPGFISTLGQSFHSHTKRLDSFIHLLGLTARKIRIKKRDSPAFQYLSIFKKAADSIFFP